MISTTDSIKPRSVVTLACVCAAAGLFAVHATVLDLWRIWRADDLKSMGMVIPLLSAALILRAWKQIGWRAEGSWWGLLLLSVTAALTFLQSEMLLTVTVYRDLLVQVPPLPLVAFCYATSIVLLFGGPRLFRAAAFPLALMLLVIPVPGLFSRLVDLPLQHASATVARAFAHALGEPLTQDRLRLMFTPDFGMFIAPGCNGIRGAVTLGLSALVVGYLYRFRWFVFAPVILGAVALGYLFNFLRLCLLVVYYKIALPHPWMQDRATGADYLIGGTLFLVALFLFFVVANRLRQNPADVTPEPHPAQQPASSNVRAFPVYIRAAAVLALAAVFAADMLHLRHAEDARAAVHPALAPLPQQLGGWTLVRTWQENLVEGTTVYTWGEYRAPANTPATPGAEVAIGISPTLGVHDTTVCHMARGEQPVVVSDQQAETLGRPASMSLALYDDGFARHLEANTLCDADSCRESADSGQHVTVIYGRPRRLLPLARGIRPVPVVLTADSSDVNLPPAAATAKLAADMRAFLRNVDLAALTAPYSRE